MDADEPAGTDRGPSSHGVVDCAELFAALGLGPGRVLVDAGCGGGAYALEAAGVVGPAGAVLALDVDPRPARLLARDAAALGLDRVQVLVADMVGGVPLAEACADACLAAGVLHMPRVCAGLGRVFGELARILRPGGALAVLECDPETWGGGPPGSRRRREQALLAAAAAAGLRPGAVRECGCMFLVLFKRENPAALAGGGVARKKGMP